jgi:phage tail-like protein
VPDRSAPYPSYTYVVYLSHPAGLRIPLGGFSEAIGLSQRPAVYRSGDESGRNPGGRKIQGTGGIHNVGDITLKRGVVSVGDLWSWMAAARNSSSAARQSATVTLRDETGTPIISWKLSKATPVRYCGPTLGGKGSGDYAIEELVLSAESIELVPPQ